MNTKLLILLSTLFVGYLSCAEHRRLTPQEYQARILQLNQFASDFITANTKPDKIRNIDNRLTILSYIVTEAVKDGVFQVVYKDGIIEKVEDIAEHNPILANNSQALIPYQGLRMQNEGVTIRGIFANNKLNAANLTKMFKALRVEKEELSKVTFLEACQNKYNEFMNPIRKEANKVAHLASLATLALIVGDLYFNKFEKTKACVVQKTTSLLATLAIISHYLRN